MNINIVKYILFLFIPALVISCGSGRSTSVKAARPVEEPRQYKLEVVAEHPHDVTSYTQGLFIHEGQMYESTGQYGSSALMKVDMQTGEALEKVSFNEKYFVEGSVVFSDALYVLTWMEKVVFIYDPLTLEYRKAMSYPREGWGMTTDGSSLIASDGTSWLYFMDADLRLEKKMQVKMHDGRAVNWLNELEYIDGKIWANVYTTDELVIINPQTGRVEGVVDCRGLLPGRLRTQDTDVLNGIAYDEKNDRIYLTGKNWPILYEVRIVEK